MKKLFFLIFLGIIFLIFVLAFFLTKKEREAEGKRYSQPSTTLLENQAAAKNIPGGMVIELVYDNQPLSIYAVPIPEEANLSLIPNFSEKEMGENLAQKYGCQAASNAGFYKREGGPLGLFYASGKIWGEKITSSLTNGFFYQEKSGKRIIGRDAPANLENLDFILQSGPYMTVGAKLRLITDEKARRLLLGIDKNNSLYLLAVLDRNNVFAGPNLADLPLIFQKPEVQEVISLTTLLNLDGGSASFFFSQKGSEKYALSELTAIGSLFCLKLL